MHLRGFKNIAAIMVRKTGAAKATVPHVLAHEGNHHFIKQIMIVLHARSLPRCLLSTRARAHAVPHGCP